MEPSLLIISVLGEQMQPCVPFTLFKIIHTEELPSILNLPLKTLNERHRLGIALKMREYFFDDVHHTIFNVINV